MNRRETLSEQLERIRLKASPVAESREQRDVLPARPGHRLLPGPLRPFFCRTCEKEVLANAVPEGWYTVNRHTNTDKSVRLGIYCSIDCLIAQTARLQGIDRDMAQRGVRLQATHSSKGE